MANAVTLRPSGAPVWVNCPGAPELWVSVPDDESDIAREGIAAHWLAEQILTGASTGEELIDRQAPNGVFIVEEMCEGVQIYVDLVVREIYEAHIEKTQPSIIPRVSPGTPDAHGITGKRQDLGFHKIVDLKYGWRVVEPFENWQLITYAHQVYHNTPHTALLTHFELIIVQPRASHPEGPVRRWTVSVEELQRVYWPRLVKAAQGGDCTTGPWCTNCPAAMTCGALRTATASAGQYAASPVAEIYSGEELATELTMLASAETYLTARIEAVREMATQRVINRPGSIPGWDLNRAKGTNQWNPDTDLDTLEKLTGVPLHKPKELTPGQAETNGLSPDIIARHSGRALGKPKLVKHNPRAIMRKMGKPPAIGEPTQ